MSRVIFRISVGFVTGALIALAVSLYLSNLYMQQQLRAAETGNLRAARGAVERAARLDPFSSEPAAAESYLDLAQGQTEAAVGALEEAIDRDPYNHRNYVALGNLQRQQLDDSEAAAESYQRALSYNPNATSVVSRLAEALLSSEDYEGAREQYQWLREAGEISLRDTYTLGRIQVRLEEPEAAIETFEAARKEAEAGLEALTGTERTEREDLLESLDLAIADALVVERRYDEAREALSESPAEQASAVLTLLEEDPESYRQSVLDAPVG